QGENQQSVSEQVTAANSRHRIRQRDACRHSGRTDRNDPELGRPGGADDADRLLSERRRQDDRRRGGRSENKPQADHWKTGFYQSGRGRKAGRTVRLKPDTPYGCVPLKPDTTYEGFS